MVARVQRKDQSLEKLSDSGDLFSCIDLESACATAYSFTRKMRRVYRPIVESAGAQRDATRAIAALSAAQGCFFSSSAGIALRAEPAINDGDGISPLLVPPVAKTNLRAASAPRQVSEIVASEIRMCANLESLTRIYSTHHAAFNRECTMLYFAQASQLVGDEGVPFSATCRRLKQHMCRELRLRADLSVDDVFKVLRLLHRMREGDLRVWDALAERFNAAAATADAIDGGRLRFPEASMILAMGNEISLRAQQGRFDPAGALVGSPSLLSSPRVRHLREKDAEVASNFIAPSLSPPDGDAHCSAIGGTLGISRHWLPPHASCEVPPPLSLWGSSAALTSMFAYLIRRAKAQAYVCNANIERRGGRVNYPSSSSTIDIDEVQQQYALPHVSLLRMMPALCSALDYELYVHGLLEARKSASEAAAAAAAAADEEGGGVSAAAPNVSSLSDSASHDSTLLASLLSSLENGSAASASTEQGDSASNSAAVALLESIPFSGPLVAPPANATIAAARELIMLIVTRETRALDRLPSLFIERWARLVDPLRSSLLQSDYSVGSRSPLFPPAAVAARVAVFSEPLSAALKDELFASEPSKWAPALLSLSARALPLMMPPVDLSSGVADSGSSSQAALSSSDSLNGSQDASLSGFLTGIFSTVSAVGSWYSAAAKWCAMRNNVLRHTTAGNKHASAAELHDPATLDALQKSLRAADEVLVSLVSLLVTVQARLATAAGIDKNDLSPQLSALETQLCDALRSLIDGFQAMIPIACEGLSVEGADPVVQFFASYLDKQRVASLAWAFSRALPMLMSSSSTSDGNSKSSGSGGFSLSVLRSRVTQLLEKLSQASLLAPGRQTSSSLLQLTPTVDPSSPYASVSKWSYDDLAALTSLLASLTHAGIDPAAVTVPLGAPSVPIGTASSTSLLEFVSSLQVLALHSRMVPLAQEAASSSSPISSASAAQEAQQQQLQLQPLHPRVVAHLDAAERSRIRRLLAASTVKPALEAVHATQLRNPRRQSPDRTSRWAEAVAAAEDQRPSFDASAIAVEQYADLEVPAVTGSPKEELDARSPPAAKANKPQLQALQASAEPEAAPSSQPAPQLSTLDRYPPLVLGLLRDNPAVTSEVRQKALQLLTKAQGEFAALGESWGDTNSAIRALLELHPGAGMTALLDCMAPSALLSRGVTLSPKFEVALSKRGQTAARLLSASPSATAQQAEADDTGTADNADDGSDVTSELKIGPVPLARDDVTYMRVSDAFEDEYAAYLARAEAAIAAHRAAAVGTAEVSAAARASHGEEERGYQEYAIDLEVDEGSATTTVPVGAVQMQPRPTVSPATSSSNIATSSSAGSSASRQPGAQRADRLSGLIKSRIFARGLRTSASVATPSSSGSSGSKDDSSGTSFLLDALLSDIAAAAAVPIGAPVPAPPTAVASVRSIQPASGASSVSALDDSLPSGSASASASSTAIFGSSSKQPRQQRPHRARPLSSTVRMQLSAGIIPRKLGPGGRGAAAAQPHVASGGDDDGGSGSDVSGSGSESDRAASSDEDVAARTQLHLRAPSEGQASGSGNAASAVRRHRSRPSSSVSSVSEPDSDSSDSGKAEWAGGKPSGGPAPAPGPASAAATSSSSATVSPALAAEAIKTEPHVTLLLTAPHRSSLVPFLLTLLRRAETQKGTAADAITARCIASVAAALQPLDDRTIPPPPSDSLPVSVSLDRLERLLLPCLGPPDSTTGDVAAVRSAIARARVAAASGGALSSSTAYRG